MGVTENRGKKSLKETYMHNNNLTNPHIADCIYKAIDRNDFFIEDMNIITREDGKRVARITSDWMVPQNSLKLGNGVVKEMVNQWKLTLEKGWMIGIVHSVFDEQVSDLVACISSHPDISIDDVRVRPI